MGLGLYFVFLVILISQKMLMKEEKEFGVIWGYY